MLQISLAVSILLCMICGTSSSLTQSVSAKGRLRCGAEPATNVHVKLVDRDAGPNPDDLLDSTYTNEKGEFLLTGYSMELTNIDPEIRISHDCNDLDKPCRREWILRIPEEYISDGEVPQKQMDFGTMNLEIELEGEGRDCL